MKPREAINPRSLTAVRVTDEKSDPVATFGFDGAASLLMTISRKMIVSAKTAMIIEAGIQAEPKFIAKYLNNTIVQMMAPTPE